jgi:hypothetical protein
MHSRSVIPALLLAVAATTRAEDTPQVTLSVPPPFATEVTVKHYRTGEDLLHDQTYHLITVAPLTQYHGWFGPRVADQADLHGWKVDVFARYSQKVAAACAAVKDGYAADLNIEPEFFGVAERSYMFARFQHKRFRWGTAVSFLSQATQDSPPHFYVPHNGHLQYEVWGVTPDKRFTVVASVSVSHPKLADWGANVRDTRTIAALRRDKDYKLVEKCSAEAFEPTLTAFNRMLDTLVIR